MSTTSTRLDQALKAAGVPIVGVSPNGASWKVFPPELQAQAQPIIDAFDPNDPKFAQADADAAVEEFLSAPPIAAILDVLADQFVLKAPPTMSRIGSGDASSELASRAPAADDLRDKVRARIRHHLTKGS